MTTKNYYLSYYTPNPQSPSQRFLSFSQTKGVYMKSTTEAQAIIHNGTEDNLYWWAGDDNTVARTQLDASSGMHTFDRKSNTVTYNVGSNVSGDTPWVSLTMTAVDDDEVPG